MNPISDAPSEARAPAQGSAPAQDRPIDPLIAALLERASALEGDAEGLLRLLRAIEAAHRTIQDGPFRNSLPADRNHLFALLADMERSGGWPYIPRLQLRTFMDLLQIEQQDAARAAGIAGAPEAEAEADSTAPPLHPDAPLAA